MIAARELPRIEAAPSVLQAGLLDFAGAWGRVLERGGLPGVDGMGVGSFARDAEGALAVIRQQMAEGGYRPDPLRLMVFRKAGGGVRSLLIPTVIDRIVQTAIARWLGASWNEAFDRASFAYRPGLGVRDALGAVAKYRDAGLRWVLDADIAGFFDAIDHDRFFGSLSDKLDPASPVTAWIRAAVSAPAWVGSRLEHRNRGIPQGSPLSPLLANVFLDPLDRELRTFGLALVRYADDLVVLCRTPFEAEEARLLLARVLRERGLGLREDKTAVTSFGRGFRFLGAEVTGDRILVPLAGARSPKPPAVYVAPCMPAGLRLTWRQGRLTPRVPFNASRPVPTTLCETPISPGRPDHRPWPARTLRHLRSGDVPA